MQYIWTSRRHLTRCRTRIGTMRICWIKLWTGNVILTTAAIASTPCNFSDTTCDCSGLRLSSIPPDLPANTTKLKLTNNSISLTHRDVQILSNLTQLRELYLGCNLICNLISGAFNNFKKLSVLELHNNYLTNFGRDVMKPLNLSHLTLYGNQWNCSCGLLGLQMWLNESKVHLGNEDITTCESPEEMKSCTIKKALIKQNGCFQVSSSASSPHSAIKRRIDTNVSKNIHKPALQSPTVTVQNTTENQTDGSGQSKFGKSWKLVVAVMATSIGISSILVLFAKCIKWYHCLFAYHHHRLREEPELFMENACAATEDSVPQALQKTKNSDQQTEVRTTSQLSEGDDGYIEDGYIDTLGFNDCEEQ
ncbi:leucine-rich repeat-containing protein 19-like isoform X2 [Scyliorhinus torazame]|uniref:leucine-rich repeat-containing protein 19-like isoform X2 n=1 Tax=Scyliorhinus torazame TaxID=75743 RepID=UPI003B5BAC93